MRVHPDSWLKFLFVVPAIIVLLVVAVWAMFGKLASGEQDWQTLTTELGSSNEHRRWRAALGLAQMLQTDQERGEAGGVRLSANRQVAERLVEMFRDELQNPSQLEDDLKHEEFLARTLGLLDVNDLVLPALRDAMDPRHDREVRKNSIASVGLIAHRMHQRLQVFEDPETLTSLVDVSSDADPMIRQISAYALALVGGDQALNQLTVLLTDADNNTRFNAAIGLGRLSSTAGVPTYLEILGNASEFSGMATETVEEQNEAMEYIIVLRNVIKAVGEVSSDLSDEQKAKLRTQLEPLAEEFPLAEIRIATHKVLPKLKLR